MHIGEWFEEQREVLYNKMVPVVVGVDVFLDEHKIFDCEETGVIISLKSHVLTLSHILDDDDQTSVHVVTSNQHIHAYTVFALDSKAGFAILKIKDSSKKFLYAKISNTKIFIIGEDLYHIGHPGYLDYSYFIGQILYLSQSYEEVHNRLNVVDKPKKRRFKNISVKHVCYVDSEKHIKRERSTFFVQVINVNDDEMESASKIIFYR